VFTPELSGLDGKGHGFISLKVPPKSMFTWTKEAIAKMWGQLA